jgi:hypothetical protein
MVFLDRHMPAYRRYCGLKRRSFLIVLCVLAIVLLLGLIIGLSVGLTRNKG